MWKLLIVEDEPGIFSLLDNSIEYGNLNLTLVGYADTGKKALALMEQQKPDVVITDIAMPTMSGLELISAAQERGLDSCFIIISGYAQFDYAQAAIKLGVEDYLIKPINRQELNDALAHVIDGLSTKRSAVTSNQQSNYRHKKLRSSYLMSLVYGQSEKLTLEEVNSQYLFSFHQGKFRYALLQVDYAQETLLGMQDYISKQIVQLFENLLSRRCSEMEITTRHNRLFLLLNYDSSQRETVEGALKQGLDNALEFADGCPGAVPTLVLGPEADSLEQLSTSFQTVEQALEARVLEGCGRLLFTENYTDKKPPRFRLSQELMSHLDAAADRKDLSNIEPLLSAALQETLDSCADCPIFTFGAVRSTLLLLLTLFKQRECLDEDLSSLMQILNGEMHSFSTPEDFTRRLPQRLLTFLQQAHKEDESKDTKVIRLALDYIEMHYSQNIRLEDVAEQVYLSPAYLGILFKKEVGENFSSYITNLRIEKSKELLRDIRLNISEVAYTVGYSNKRYFSRVFKEWVGISPKEYQKVHSRDLY